jgi:hypothetical protein
MIVRKNIDLPKEAIKKLNILAAEHDTNAKNYIEELVLSHLFMNPRKTKKK